jgi:thioredoxin 1
MKQLLYFTAGWCPSCQNMTPIVDQLKRTNSIPIQKIDIDYDGTFVPKYNVKSVPTVIVLENGEEIKRYVGALTSNQLNNLING